MAAKLSILKGKRWWSRCSNCDGEVQVDQGWSLSWTYGNGSSSRLAYCQIECLPADRQEEAIRKAGRPVMEGFKPRRKRRNARPSS